MKRRILVKGEVVMRSKILSCVVVLCLALCVFALDTDASGLKQISKHVYAYVDVKNASPAGNSFGANAGLIVGSDSALVIDTLVSAKEADRFLADIKKVTAKPIKYVVNTHYHLDHAWGNCRFVELGAVVIAHEKAKAHLTESEKGISKPEMFGLTAEDLKGTKIQGPAITFAESAGIDLGGVTVELRYLGPAHTDDGITAYVPQDKVLFTGDILFTRYHPFLAEGDLASWRKILSELEQTPAEKIIPGHGPVSSKADIKDMKTYLSEFDTQAKALCAGKKAGDVAVIAKELMKRLPQQKRTEMPQLVGMNLQFRYLQKSELKK